MGLTRRREAVERLLPLHRCDDCVHLVERYLAELRQPAPERPPPPLTARKVAAVLGRPSRRASYGDVVLFKQRPDPDGGPHPEQDAALGIHLGYCVLTVVPDGSMARLPTPARLLAWSV